MIEDASATDSQLPDAPTEKAATPIEAAEAPAPGPGVREPAQVTLRTWRFKVAEVLRDLGHDPSAVSGGCRRLAESLVDADLSLAALPLDAHQERRRVHADRDRIVGQLRRGGW
jgi:hypothetical protein